MQLADTSAIVTGGASGLGAATAAALAAKGASVFALDLQASIDKATPVDGVTLVPTDVTNEDEVRAAVILDPRWHRRYRGVPPHD